MTNEKINATVENAPATVTVPTEKKINLKKADKKNAPAPAENVPAAVTAPVSVPAPALADIEAKKAEITAKIELLNVRGKEIATVDKKASELSPTNWGKDTTPSGGETLGSFVRGLLKQYAVEIIDLKRELKCLYFTLDPVLVALQDSENELAKNLVNACVDNMRNIPIVSVDDYYEKAYYASYKREPKESINEKIVEALKVLASAGVERVGIATELLGIAIPLLASVGYTFESIAQPVVIDEINIAGLDRVPACTYYSFKKA